MIFRWLILLAALLASFAPAQEICSITGTVQKVVAKSPCCETTCSHCEGKTGADKAKASPLCMENDRPSALTTAEVKAFPDAGVTQIIYALPGSISIAPRLSKQASFVDSPPPFFTGKVLLSVVLRS